MGTVCILSRTFCLTLKGCKYIGIKVLVFETETGEKIKCCHINGTMGGVSFLL